MYKSLVMPLPVGQGKYPWDGRETGASLPMHHDLLFQNTTHDSDAAVPGVMVDINSSEVKTMKTMKMMMMSWALVRK